MLENQNGEPEKDLNNEQEATCSNFFALQLDFDNEMDALRKFRDEKGYLQQQGFDNQQEAIEWQLSNIEKKYREATDNLLSSFESIDSQEVLTTCLVILNYFVSCAERITKTTGISIDLSEIRSRLTTNFPKFESVLKNNPDKRAKILAIDLVVSVACSNKATEREDATNFLIANLPEIRKYLENEAMEVSAKTETSYYGYYGSRQVADALAVVLKFGTAQEESSVIELVKNFLKNESTFTVGSELLADMFYARSPDEKDPLDEIRVLQPRTLTEFRGILCKSLENAGISQKTALDLTKKWTEENQARRMFVSANLHSVMRLEKLQHGITSTLLEKYGITEFGRYPDQMLLKQYENMDNTEDPYGIVLFPKDDWNGAFHSRSEIFRELMHDLERTQGLEHYLVRTFECGSKIEVARTLIKLDRQFGEKHKISFAIIGGHGSKDSICLGNMQNGFSRGHLFTNDLYGRGVRRTRDFFEQGATIILSACSTGENEGIGQTLSEKFGMKVIAPTIPTGLSLAKPKLENGRISFDVQYNRQNLDDKNIMAIYEPSGEIDT